MPTKTFAYEALDSTGSLMKGRLESNSAESAANMLADQKLTPLSNSPGSA
jgi:type IV pilus assembly protein PilC